jgi:hypothetical protein
MDGIAGRDSDALGALLQEAELVHQAIRGVFLFSERVVALGLSIISLAATVGIAEGHAELLLILPFAVLGVLGYGVHLGTELLYLGGYRWHLEDRINQILDRDFLTWDSQIVPTYRRFPNADGEIGRAHV